MASKILGPAGTTGTVFKIVRPEKCNDGHRNDGQRNDGQRKDDDCDQ